jgi:hypothetical protein
MLTPHGNLNTVNNDTAETADGTRARTSAGINEIVDVICLSTRSLELEFPSRSHQKPKRCELIP